MRTEPTNVGARDADISGGRSQAKPLHFSEAANFRSNAQFPPLNSFQCTCRMERRPSAKARSPSRRPTNGLARKVLLLYAAPRGPSRWRSTLRSNVRP